MGQPEKYECLWPLDAGHGPVVENYATEIVQRSMSQWGECRVRTFRPANVPGQETLFLSASSRNMFEHAFLRAGLTIRSRQINPKPHLRPLGFECLESLGFGALFVTFRNIANNCPLALWWGKNNWTPLFPRKPNPQAPMPTGSCTNHCGDYPSDIPF
jgi:hypothetical protein